MRPLTANQINGAGYIFPKVVAIFLEHLKYQFGSDDESCVEYATDPDETAPVWCLRAGNQSLAFEGHDRRRGSGFHGHHTPVKERQRP